MVRYGKNGKILDGPDGLADDVLKAIEKYSLPASLVIILELFDEHFEKFARMWVKVV